MVLPHMHQEEPGVDMWVNKTLTYKTVCFHTPHLFIFVNVMPNRKNREKIYIFANI